MNLKVLNETDNYDVQDFNYNFSVVAQAIADLERRMNIAIVTGIMTSNRAFNLGSRPRAVFIFPSNISNPDNALIGRMYAMATTVNNGEQRQLSTGAPVLEITDTGFTTRDLTGTVNGSSSTIGASDRLRYVVFR